MGTETCTKSFRLKRLRWSSVVIPRQLSLVSLARFPWHVWRRAAKRARFPEFVVHGQEYRPCLQLMSELDLAEPLRIVYPDIVVKTMSIQMVARNTTADSTMSCTGGGSTAKIWKAETASVLTAHAMVTLEFGTIASHMARQAMDGGTFKHIMM